MSRIASTKSSVRRGAKPSSHHRPEHLHLATSAVDARLDPADEAIAEEDRQHVPAPTPPGRRDEELPHIVELGGVVNQYAARPSVIDVFAPITMAPKGVSRFGAHGFGCCDCRDLQLAAERFDIFSEG